MKKLLIVSVLLLFMKVDKIPLGKNSPNDVNVIIEVPANSNPVKYEFDKDSGAIIVDRFIPVNMSYPANYGFIPHTLADDGDPLDALVLTRFPLIPGSVINSRPIGVLIMEDEKGMDEKIISVPNDKVDPFYKNIKDIKDLDEILLLQIKHFFERYKDLEPGKWVKVKEFKDSKVAKELIKKYSNK
jgi:inorganic pyrophosphatase